MFQKKGEEKMRPLNDAEWHNFGNAEEVGL